MKRFRDLCSLAESAGLTVLSISRHKHITMRCRRADGAIRTFFNSATPSDWRGDRNFRAELRRFGRKE